MQNNVEKENVILLQNQRNCCPDIQNKIFLTKCEIYWNVRVPLFCCFQVQKETAAKFITLEQAAMPH
jgi:hypothetical protein